MESYYNKLAHLRKQYPVLRNGSFVTLLTGDTQQSNTAANTYAFARVLANTESAVVAMNNGSSSNTANIPVGGLFTDGTQLQDALSGATYAVSGGNVQVTLAARTGVVLLPSPVNLDLAPPIASISTTPGANGNGWINSLPVTVNFSATDSGSGVEQLRYWINNGPVTAVAGSSASTQLTAQGSYSVGLRAIDNAGNISALATANFGIDVTPPVVNVSASPSSLWPANGKMVQVTVSGTITDSLSGVNPSTAAFAVMDEYGSVQPSGPVTLGTGGSYSFKISLQASRKETTWTADSTGSTLAPKTTPATLARLGRSLPFRTTRDIEDRRSSSLL